MKTGLCRADTFFCPFILPYQCVSKFEIDGRFAFSGKAFVLKKFFVFQIMNKHGFEIKYIYCCLTFVLTCGVIPLFYHAIRVLLLVSEVQYFFKNIFSYNYNVSTN